MNLKNTEICIPGGNRGIGLALISLLANICKKIIVIDKDPTSGIENVEYVKIDFSDPNQLFTNTNVDILVIDTGILNGNIKSIRDLSGLDLENFISTTIKENLRIIKETNPKKIVFIINEGTNAMQSSCISFFKTLNDSLQAEGVSSLTVHTSGRIGDNLDMEIAKSIVEGLENDTKEVFIPPMNRVLDKLNFLPESFKNTLIEKYSSISKIKSATDQTKSAILEATSYSRKLWDSGISKFNDKYRQDSGISKEDYERLFEINNRLKERNKILFEKNNKSKEDIKKLKQESSNKEELRNKLLNCELKRFIETETKLRKNVIKIKDEINALTNELKNKEKENKTQESKFKDEINALTNETKNNMKGFIEKESKLKDEMNALTNEVKVKENEIKTQESKFKEEIAALNKNVEIKENKLKEEIYKLKYQISVHKLNEEKLSKEVEDKSKHICKLNDKVEKLEIDKDFVSELQKKLRSFEISEEIRILKERCLQKYLKAYEAKFNDDLSCIPVKNYLIDEFNKNPENQKLEYLKTLNSMSYENIGKSWYVHTREYKYLAPEQKKNLEEMTNIVKRNKGSINDVETVLNIIRKIHKKTCTDCVRKHFGNISSEDQNLFMKLFRSFKQSEEQ